jgi:quinol-cytochrome oxidoreductase complex cytochrome b subunit
MENTTPARSLRDRLLDWLEQRVDLSELFSFLTHFGLLTVPLDTRKPLRELLRDLDRTALPAYATGRQMLGVLMALLFGLEAVTGLLLAFYYRPTPDAAHASTLSIVRDLPLGGLIHQLHAWGALLLVVIVGLRVVRLFWDGLYQAPRELSWVAAVFLSWVVLQFDFTGRLLPWDANGYWSVVRGLEVIHGVPVIGPVLAFFVGGHTMSEDLLTRFYVLHVGLLPLLWLVGVYVTVATLRRVGLGSIAQMKPGAGTTTTLRRHRYDLGILLMLSFAVLATLAVLVPFRFSGAADPYTTPPDALPPWHLLGASTLMQATRVPMVLTGGLVLLLGLAILTLPWWAARLGERFPTQRLRLAGVVTLGLWLVLSVAGLLVGRS